MNVDWALATVDVVSKARHAEAMLNVIFLEVFIAPIVTQKDLNTV